MTQFMYRCPHCQAKVEVTLDQISGVNVCPACSRPFRPEVPVGRILQQRDDGEWAVSGATALAQPSIGEKKVVTVHPAMFRANPLRYLVMVVLFVIGLAGMLIFAIPMQNSALENLWRPLTIVIAIAFALLAAVSLLSMLYWLMRTRFEALTITSERTIWARGILDRETSEVQHDDVRNIQMRQTFADRILGVGRIAISSAGQDDMEIDIRGVPKPSQVADTIRSCQARMTGRTD